MNPQSREYFLDKFNSLSEELADVELSPRSKQLLTLAEESKRQLFRFSDQKGPSPGQLDLLRSQAQMNKEYFLTAHREADGPSSFTKISRSVKIPIKGLLAFYESLIPQMLKPNKVEDFFLCLQSQSKQTIEPSPNSLKTFTIKSHKNQHQKNGQQKEGYERNLQEFLFSDDEGVFYLAKGSIELQKYIGKSLNLTDSQPQMFEDSGLSKAKSKAGNLPNLPFLEEQDEQPYQSELSSPDRSQLQQQGNISRMFKNQTILTSAVQGELSPRKVQEFAKNDEDSHYLSQSISKHQQKQKSWKMGSGSFAFNQNSKNALIYERHSQVRQGGFFSIINTKPLWDLSENFKQELNHTGVIQAQSSGNRQTNERIEKDFLKIVPLSSECIIVKIAINPKYYWKQLLEQKEKVELLQKVFSGNGVARLEGEDILKSSKFKQIVALFQKQTFRRGAQIVTEGRATGHMYVKPSQSDERTEEKLYIVKGNPDGSQVVALSKKAFFSSKMNNIAEDSQTLQLCKSKGRGIFNGQRLLSGSKLIGNLMETYQSRHPFENQQKTQHGKRIQIEVNSEQGVQNDVSDDSECYFSLPETRSKDMNEQADEKQISSQSALHYLKMHNPFKTRSQVEEVRTNFTLKAESAHVVVYSVPLRYLLSLQKNKDRRDTNKSSQNKRTVQIPDNLKQNLIRNYEEFYVTYIRQSVQKLKKFSQSNIRKLIKDHQRLTEIKGVMEAESLIKKNLQEQEAKRKMFSLPKSVLQFHHSEGFKGLKSNQQMVKKGRDINFKMQAIELKRMSEQGRTFNQNTRKIGSKMSTETEIYKNKIEHIILKNLENIKELEHISGLSKISHLYKKSFGAEDDEKQAENISDTTKILDHQKQAMKAMNEFYLSKVQEIFMQENRSEAIMRQSTILDKKMQIASKRFNSTKNSSEEDHEKVFKTSDSKDLMLDSDQYDPIKNKEYKINLIRKGLAVNTIQARNENKGAKIGKDVNKNSHEHPCPRQNFLKGINSKNYTQKIRNQYAEKITKTNKIKQQHLKIQSKCDNCHCYDDLDSFGREGGKVYERTTGYESAHRVKDSQTDRYSTHELMSDSNKRWEEINKGTVYRKYLSDGRRKEGSTPNLSARNSVNDVKYHTMKIGVNWRKNRSISSGALGTHPHNLNEQKAMAATARPHQQNHRGQSSARRFSQNQVHASSRVEEHKKMQAEQIERAINDDEPFEQVYNRIKVLNQKSMEKYSHREHLAQKSSHLSRTKNRKKSAPLLGSPVFRALNTNG